VSASIATRGFLVKKEEASRSPFRVSLFRFFRYSWEPQRACSEPEVKWVVAEVIEEVQIEKNRS
jgi:hypothetical protein